MKPLSCDVYLHAYSFRYNVYHNLRINESNSQLSYSDPLYKKFVNLYLRLYKLIPIYELDSFIFFVSIIYFLFPVISNSYLYFFHLVILFFQSRISINSFLSDLNIISNQIPINIFSIFFPICLYIFCIIYFVNIICIIYIFI